MKRQRSTWVAAAGAFATLVLVAPPAAVLDSPVLAPFLFGLGLAQREVTLVLGSVRAAIPGALFVATLLLVLDAVRGRRPSRGAAVVGAVFASFAVFHPQGYPATVASALPFGRILIVLAALMPLVAAFTQRGPAEKRSRRPLLVLLVWFCLGGAWGARATRHPPMPSGWFARPTFVHATPAQPFPAEPPPVHPHLAPPPRGNIHMDAWMTDAYVGGPKLVDPATAKARSFLAGGVCASITFDKKGRLVTTCLGVTHVHAWLLDPQSLEPIAHRVLAERPFHYDFATNFGGGGYASLDDRDRFIVGLPGGRIQRLRIENDQFVVDGEVDIKGALLPDEGINSVLPDASGALWFVGRLGTIGFVDENLGSPKSMHFEGADIENSFALDVAGGAVVVTSKELVAVEIGPAGPVVRFRVGYDPGVRKKPGQSSRASGTTPTIFAGGRLVAITDNAEPRMHVVVYRMGQDEKAAKERKLCEVPVFADGRSASENSLIAMGNSLFVENNYGYSAFATVWGHLSDPGLARIDVDEKAGTCKVAWERHEVTIPSVVAKGVADDGIILAYDKTPSAWGADLWSFVGIDATTGDVRWRRPAGAGLFANNHYAAIYKGPRGEIFIGCIGGILGLVP